MPPAKSWDDEDDDSSSSPESTPAPVVRRSKFDDEEDEDDVLDSWDAAEDSEAEREKAKKAEEAKAKAEAEAKANKKSKSQRIEEKRMENMRRKAEMDDMSSDEEEDEATKREHMRQMEKEADLKNAADLFGEIGIPSGARPAKPVTLAVSADPTQTVELSSLKIFDPTSRDQFVLLRETLVPLLAANAKKAQYSPFIVEFAKQIVKDLPSEQIKKVASALTTMSNEKMKEEKAADKGGKKTKAAKTKTTLNAVRDVGARADTTAYDDGGLDDGDFM